MSDKGAEALIEAIETMYPNWRKFRDLAEAIYIHNKNRDARIKQLEKHNNELRVKLDPKHNDPVKQVVNYLAVVSGGIGPDVWDKEVSVFAKDIAEVVRIIDQDLPHDAAIISIEQTE